jgi:putative transposase
MHDSHTATSIDEAAADSSPLRLVSTATKALPEWLAGRVDEHLAVFAAHMTQGLLAASTAAGLEVMAELLDAEVTELTGPKGKHNPARVAMRHGSEPGTVTLGGRRLQIRRPRVRTTGETAREVPLESYTAFCSTELLAEGIVARMLAGLLTRRYSPSCLEPVGEQVDTRASGTSKSAVSRRFVAATAERLSELLARRLDDRRWLLVFLDGFSMGEHLLVGALGVTQDRTKVPLGVAEGTTENKAVCTRLVADLAERGLDASRGVLFVIDGGKALERAIRSVFGQRRSSSGAVSKGAQRYRPPARGGAAAGAAAAARRLGQPRPRPSQGELERLARGLDRQRPDAAASLGEGLELTLTVTRLGVGGKLLQTVASTNPMESMIEIAATTLGG